MNPLIQLKTTPPLLITLALLCFVPLPRVQAVVPPPDGGYPNFTTAEGQNALFSLTTGSANTAVGWSSLFSNAKGSFNTATGAGALLFTNGDPTVNVGEASNNTATGALALFSNTTGGTNTANGVFALFSNITGTGNTANGYRALYSNTTGAGNTAVGSNAGDGVTTGSNNVYIGSGVPGVAGESNTTRIRNVYASVASGRAVYVNSDNKVGTLVSSLRFKDGIKPMDEASEAILALKPVTFCYKKEIEPNGAIMFGLIAEDVEKVDPDLVTRNDKGEPETVRYEAVNAMLLNEFLKEHRKNEEQGATIAELRKAIARLAARDEEQAAQIQKVSSQLEASKPAPQVVNNP